MLWLCVNPPLPFAVTAAAVVVVVVVVVAAGISGTGTEETDNIVTWIAVGEALAPTLESSVELPFHVPLPTNHTLYSNQLFFVDLFRSLALIGEWLLPARL